MSEHSQLTVALDSSWENKGKKYLGRAANVHDLQLFMTQCFINDRGILPYIDNTGVKSQMLPILYCLKLGKFLKSARILKDLMESMD